MMYAPAPAPAPACIPLHFISRILHLLSHPLLNQIIRMLPFTASFPNNFKIYFKRLQCKLVIWETREDRFREMRLKCRCVITCSKITMKDSPSSTGCQSSHFLFWSWYQCPVTFLKAPLSSWCKGIDLHGGANSLTGFNSCSLGRGDSGPQTSKRKSETAIPAGNHCCTLVTANISFYQIQAPSSLFSPSQWRKSYLCSFSCRKSVYAQIQCFIFFPNISFLSIFWSWRRTEKLALAFWEQFFQVINFPELSGSLWRGDSPASNSFSYIQTGLGRICTCHLQDSLCSAQLLPSLPGWGPDPHPGLTLSRQRPDDAHTSHMT